jgi:hypothetical protein
MKRLGIAALALLVMGGAACAHWKIGGFNGGVISNGAATCSNKLDFSQACNSQYLP